MDNEEIQNRKNWFDFYTDRIVRSPKRTPEANGMFRCPCCGYPTLRECGGHNICYLCSWQDDGQDDPRADEVWGGPNKEYSLTEARKNWRLYWVMFAPGRDSRIGGGDNAIELEAKKAIVAAFDTMRSLNDFENTALTAAVENNRIILRQELKKRLRVRQK